MDLILQVVLKFKCKQYTGPYILRPPIRPEKYGLKLKLILNFQDIYIESVSLMSLASLKMEGSLKWQGLKSQSSLYTDSAFWA